MIRLLTKDRSARLPREWSNRVLKQIAPFFKGHIINVSGWDDRDKEGGTYSEYFTNSETYSVSNYTGKRGKGEDQGITDCFIDLSQVLADELVEKFDVVFNHTTLEHIYDVQTAFANLCKLSSNVVVLVVPFAQVTHPTDSFGDYWRFCPMALREMFCQNGFSVIFEAKSPHKNAGTYLFSVGARKPDDWCNVLPAYEPTDIVGSWIGQTIRSRILQSIMTIKKWFRTIGKAS